MCMRLLRKAKWFCQTVELPQPTHACHTAALSRQPRGLFLLLVMSVVAPAASVFSHVMPVDADVSADMNQRLHDILAEVEFLRYSNTEIEHRNSLLLQSSSFLEEESSALSTAGDSSPTDGLMKDALHLKDVVHTALSKAKSMMVDAMQDYYSEESVTSIVDLSEVNYELCNYRISEIEKQTALLGDECPGLVNGSKADLEASGANVVEKCTHRMEEIDRNLKSMKTVCPGGSELPSKAGHTGAVATLQGTGVLSVQESLSSDTQAEDEQESSCDRDLRELEHTLQELESSCPAMTTESICEEPADLESTA